MVVIAAILFELALPLAPAQVLWINMVTSSTLGLALAFEPAESGIMRRRPRPPGVPLLSGFFVWRVLMVSILMMAGALGLFLWELDHGTSLETARTIAVNAVVAAEIEKRTGKETRNCVLGHLQRGGSPTTFDRALCSMFGATAVELIAAGDFGKMVAHLGPQVGAIPLGEAVGKLKTVKLDGNLIRTARALGISMGD